MRIMTPTGKTTVTLTDAEVGAILTAIAIAYKNWHLRDPEVSVKQEELMAVSGTLMKAALDE
jgi:hypothetical protein